LKNIVISLLGVTLDQSKGEKRWNKWRPSVAVCQQQDLLVSEFHLLYQRKYSSLAKRVIDDIKQVSPETKVIPRLIEFINPWDFEEVYSVLHNFASDFIFDQDNNNYLLHITTGTHVAQICIFLLTESRLFPGKLVQTSPGRETHGVSGSYDIIDLDLSKYDKIAERFNQEFKDDISFLKAGIETKNKAFNKLIERIEYVAMQSKEPILLTGPTGAGKSSLAKRIYDLKKVNRQVEGAFVEVNCATLRGDTAMSTLFGHKKGSFTGALTERTGLLKAANKGILFLDEIGELGSDEQTMLLRAIEEKRFMPVGADQETDSDFQIICGTNNNLNKTVSTGKFREDLLARIKLWSFKLPGLKERKEDIEPNLQYEMSRYAQKNGIHASFNKEAKELFLKFALSPGALWKANFRDLNAAITRMSTLAPNSRITKDIVAEEIRRLNNEWEAQASNPDKQIICNIAGKETYDKMDPFDIHQLASVLRTCQNCSNLSQAGRILFAMSRLEKKTSNDADRLKKYLARFNINWEIINSTANTNIK